MLSLYDIKLTIKTVWLKFWLGPEAKQKRREKLVLELIPLFKQLKIPELTVTSSNDYTLLSFFTETDLLLLVELDDIGIAIQPIQNQLLNKYDRMPDIYKVLRKIFPIIFSTKLQSLAYDIDRGIIYFGREAEMYTAEQASNIEYKDLYLVDKPDNDMLN